MVNSSKVVLWIMAIGFLASDAAYVVWSLLQGQFEVIGTITMGLSGIMCALIAFYFTITQRESPAGSLPEDRLDADIDDGDPEVGHFSPWSWWPILLAGAIGMFVVGMAIGTWFAVIIVPFVVVCLIGWAFEDYRGNFAR